MPSVWLLMPMILLGACKTAGQAEQIDQLPLTANESVAFVNLELVAATVEDFRSTDFTYEVSIQPVIRYHEGESYVGSYLSLAKVEFTPDQEYELIVQAVDEKHIVRLSSEDCESGTYHFLDSGFNTITIELCRLHDPTLLPMSLSEVD